MENKYFLSKDELVRLLENNFNPIDINDIISAYDIADQAYGGKKALSGQPYFFHTTRVIKILIEELFIKESNLIIAALLHDINKTSADISDEIINYNFNPYVTKLINILKEDYEYIERNQHLLKEFNLNELQDDYLIIWLAEHLDNLRYPAVTPELNPLNYVLNVSAYYFPISKNSNSPIVKYLISELQKEKNKILS